MPANVSNAWEATRIVYQEVARRKQATIWGEKTPHWYDCPLYMAEKFPDARFIFLWRDMNAVVESIARAALTEHFFRKPGIAMRAMLGNERLREGCDALKASGRQVHELNYEDLTSDTAECMQQICRFLDVPFESQTTSLQGADRSAICSGQHHVMVRGNLIVAQERQSPAVSPAMRIKIRRYVFRWKERYQGKWPKYPLDPPPHTRPPSLVGLWHDQLAYQSMVFSDKAVKLIYAIMPLALARLVRRWVRGRSYATEPLSRPQ
jgi:hypothetical protein